MEKKPFFSFSFSITYGKKGFFPQEAIEKEKEKKREKKGKKKEEKK